MTDKRVKTVKDGRLVYYYDQPDPEFWDGYWDQKITREYYQPYEKGDLDEYAFFLDHIHKDDRILEAGCGPAQYVVALWSQGFQNAEGIDWGEKTINRVRSIFPDLHVRSGDITALDVEKDYFDVYISLGVMEHMQDGPDAFLIEAYRILKPGGYAFISVPYYNSLRLFKSWLGYYRRISGDDLIFYQYAYQKDDFMLQLTKNRFEVIDCHGIFGYRCIEEEFPALYGLLTYNPRFRRIQRYLKRNPWFNDHWGHMIIYTCRKPE